MSYAGHRGSARLKRSRVGRCASAIHLCAQVPARYARLTSRLARSRAEGAGPTGLRPYWVGGWVKLIKLPVIISKDSAVHDFW